MLLGRWVYVAGKPAAPVFGRAAGCAGKKLGRSCGIRQVWAQRSRRLLALWRARMPLLAAVLHRSTPGWLCCPACNSAVLLPLTDLYCLLPCIPTAVHYPPPPPLSRCNAAKNRMLVPSAPAPSPLPPTQQQRQQQAPAPGSVAVLGLDWEDGPGAAAAAATITAAGPVDLIVGTDCIYPDPDGSVPDSSALLATVCALATPGRTRALLSFEARSDALRRALLDAASAAPLACRVRMLPPETLPEAYRAPHIELYELSF